MATTKTYLGAVKPVGSKIVFHYVPIATKVSDGFVDFDFKLVNNYFLTGVSITKVGAGLTAASASMLSATVLAVQSDGTTELPIACAAFLAPATSPVVTVSAGAYTGYQGLGALGEKAIAGLPSITIASGTPVALPAAGTVKTALLADAGLFPFQTVGGLTNYPTIRLRISWDYQATPVDARCVVEIDVAKSTLNSYLAGTGSVGNGQGSEVIDYVS